MDRGPVSSQANFIAHWNVRKNTPYCHVEFARRKQIEVDDFSTCIASKEDLIISKLFRAKDSDSETQMRNAKNLIATGGDAIYIEKWTRELVCLSFGRKRNNERHHPRNCREDAGGTHDVIQYNPVRRGRPKCSKLRAK
jgi:hypothetical protein